MKMNYGSSIPLGQTADYIRITSFRGSGFEFGRFLNDDLSVGFLISWCVFMGVSTGIPSFINAGPGL